MFRAVIAAALVFACAALQGFVGRAHAHEMEILTRAECPPRATYDPTLVTRSASVPSRPCDPNLVMVFAIEDTWLGIRWHVPRHGYASTGVPVEAHGDADEKHKKCIVKGPDGIFVDMWLTQTGNSCATRNSNYTGVYRRIENEQICIMPAGACIPIESLLALGRSRAETVIDRARSHAELRN